MPEPVPELLDALRTKPSQAGILTDFDGTLAKIVDEPADARPLDGVPELLDQLASRYAVVAVLSGRPVRSFERWLPSSVVLSGLYGLEVVRDGVAVDNPNAAPWRRDRRRGVRGRAHQRTGTACESSTRAFRSPFTSEATRRSRSRSTRSRSNSPSGRGCPCARLACPSSCTRRSTSTRAPRSVELTAGLEAVCFMGDDVGDLPAFRALDELAADDVSCVRIGVRSEEAPRELLDAVDVVVDGPEGVRDLLAQL